jgi:gluconate 2-dehydrogenase gamma chain
MAGDTIARRKFLLGAGVAGTAVAAGISGATPAEAQTQVNQVSASAPRPTAEPPAAEPPAAEPPTWLTLNAAEVAFFAAAVDTLIPADEFTPSGSDCGLVTFVDRQLASAWGGGAKS